MKFEAGVYVIHYASSVQVYLVGPSPWFSSLPRRSDGAIMCATWGIFRGI